MRWRIALCALAVLCVAAPAGGVNPYTQKEAVDAKLARIQATIAELESRENSLRSDIAGYTSEIHVLERKIGTVEARLEPLQRDLNLHEARLASLHELFRLQTERLRFLRTQFKFALDRLNRRLVGLYENGQPGTLEIILSASSLTEILEQLDFLELLADQDKRIARAVEDARDEARVARAKTKVTRRQVAAITRVIAERAAQVREVRDRLADSRSHLDESREQRRQRLASVAAERREWVSEADSLKQASVELAAKIRSASGEAPDASTGAGASPSAAGLIWPVSAPITSPYGMRWGRLHAGIDLGAGEGTPIRASAAGLVIYAGWLGGYGNLVVVDHGGGLSTAYAHQSRTAASTGQRVGQGEVIGYVGNTGHSFGPHLHFEVRINGSAVDPLGYL